MNPMQMILGLIPWWVFSSMASRTGEHAAANAAVVSAIVSFVIANKDRKRGGYKILDVTGIVTFAGLAVIAYAGGDGAERWVADYGRGASTLILAAAMFVSVLTVPFTEQYARQSAPPEVWHSRTFRAVNRKISLVWAIAVALMSSGHWIAGKVDPTSGSQGGSRPTELLLNWVVPLVLVFAAVAYTRYAAANAGKQRSGSAGTQLHETAGS